MPWHFGRRQYGHGVLVSHPARQHSWATARALQRADLLQAYFTSINYDARYWPYGLLDALLLPSHLRRRLRAQLKKREVRIDDRSAVRTPGLWPLVLTAARPLMNTEARTSRFNRFLDAIFDRWVSGELASASPLAVHCYQGSALRTFTRAKQLHIPRVLDVTSDHTGIVRTLRQEAGLLRNAGLLDDLTRVDKAYFPQTYTERALADYLLVPSEHVRHALMADGIPEHKIVLMPYGVDSDTFTPPAASRTAMDRPFTALFVGTLNIAKGIQYLLNAWAELALPDAELVIVGGGGDRAIRTLREHGVQNVRWAGNVSHSTVLKYYREADIFVFPSLSEGSALVVYEAMACGLPVITTPTAGSVVRDGIDGYIVPPRDVPALKDKIETLYRDRVTLTRMGQNARGHVVSSHTWKHYEQRLAAFYRDMVFGDRGEVEYAETATSEADHFIARPSPVAEAST